MGPSAGFFTTSVKDGGFNEEIQEDFGNCFDCLTNPNGECDTSYDDGIFPTSN